MINDATIESPISPLSSEENSQSHTIAPLQGELRYNLEHALIGMYKLFEEIKEKREFIHQKSSALKVLIEELKQKNIIKAAEALEKGLEKSLNDYYALSDMLAGEIVSHVSYYNRYLSPQSTNEQAENKEENSEKLPPLRPIEALPQEIKLLVSYAKNRKKDLSIIFSRYDHGLTTRMRNFESIQTQADAVASQPTK